MKQYILALVLAVVSASVAFAVNPIKEGNIDSGDVIVKYEENIPYATVLIIGSGLGTVSNEEGKFEFRKLPRGRSSSVCGSGLQDPREGGDGEQGLYCRHTFPDGRGEFHDR